MFSGIVEEVGVIERSAEGGSGGRDLVISAETVLDDLRPGDSISIDGVCQTVVELGRQSFKVNAVATTLSRTTLGTFRAGRQVNLERPVAVGGRFGGHFVQGHVDGVGAIRAVERRDDVVLLRFSLPDTVRRYTILHGSTAVNGVSLTINGLLDSGTAEVALIPYTLEHTNLSRLTSGDRVNIEADMIGKYVVQALSEHGAAEVPGFAEQLSKWGIR